MFYYPTDALYLRIISELAGTPVTCTTTSTGRLTLLFRALLSGFVAGWRRSLLPEHWLAQQLRLVAYRALQRGDDLNDPTVQKWCLMRLTDAWNPTTDGGRVLQHAGACTPVFDSQQGVSAIEPQPNLRFAEAIVTGLNTLRSTWRLLQTLPSDSPLLPGA